MRTVGAFSPPFFCAINRAQKSSRQEGTHAPPAQRGGFARARRALIFEEKPNLFLLLLHAIIVRMEGFAGEIVACTHARQAAAFLARSLACV